MQITLSHGCQNFRARRHKNSGLADMVMDVVNHGALEVRLESRNYNLVT